MEVFDSMPFNRQGEEIMICNFTGTSCKYTSCGLWSEERQDCCFAMVFFDL